MKTLLATLIYICFIANISAQNSTVDSLRQLLTSLPEDTTKLKVYTELTNELNFVDLDQAKQTGITGIALAKKLNKNNLTGYMQIAMGRSYANSGKIDSAEHHFLIAQDLFKKTQSKEGKAAVLTKLIYVSDYNGHYEKSANLAFELLKLQEELQNKTEIAFAYVDIGNANYGLLKYDKCIEYAQKALDIFKEQGDKNGQSKALNLISNAYHQTGEYEKGLKSVNEALVIIEESGELFDKAATLNTRANLYRFWGKYPESIQDYKSILEITQQFGADGFTAATLSNMGDAYNRQNKHAEALKIHLQAIKMRGQGATNVERRNQAYNLAESYGGIQQYDSAFHYRSIQLELTDSVYNENSNAITSELQTKYETSQKEALIYQQKSELDIKNTQQKYMTGIGGLLILLLGGAFFAYRSKQKSNLALEEKNNEITTLFGEVHHRVKNNLQILSSLLHLQSRHITDDAALSAVREGQNRVEAMGLIHQKLYTRDNTSAIEISDYLNELGENLTNTLTHDDRIIITYDTPKLFLDVDTSIPLGLIVNELITNSLKYGFPNDREGKIHVKLAIDQQSNLNLTVSDNGEGSSSARDLKLNQTTKKSTAFGTQLIHILCKKLKGKIIVLEKETGYTTEICFSKWK